MVEALGSGVGAGVLLLGLIFARRYGNRAEPSLTARTFARPDGQIGLDVEIKIKAVGLNSLRVVDDDKLVGWLVKLAFSLPRPIARWLLWTFEETEFIPLGGWSTPSVGSQGETDDASREARRPGQVPGVAHRQ